MKKLMMGILVMALLISATANSMIVFAEETYDTFSYYDADNDVYVTEYYYNGYDEETYNSTPETFSYYDADNDMNCIEYYYYGDNSDDEDVDEYEQNGYVADYSDLYQDEYQAAWYSPAKLNDWADFYSIDGEYICSIPSGTYVQPVESIGRSGDITHIIYDGKNGYVYTALLVTPNPYYGVTYDEINQSDGGPIVQVLYDTYLLDEYGNILAELPAGYGVELIRFDETYNICWVRWNGLFGSINASVIWNDDPNYYDDDVEYSEEYECYEEYGRATIKPQIGANVRDYNNDIVIAVPHGEEVVLLENLNIGGRTLIRWRGYIGTVLTSCLTVC